MKYSVTVDQAIARGKWLCVFLPAIFFFMPLGAGLAGYYFDKNWWYIGIGVAAGIVLSWLSWSCTVVRWKLWAYTNVRNVHELQKRAIEDRIIWPDGNFFNRTEIKTREQRYALDQLEARFRERDVFNDDAAVPLETYVYISKGQMYFNAALGVFFIGLGIYLYTGAETLKEKLYTYVAPLVGVYLLFVAVKGLRNTKPVLVLSDEGIRLQGKGLRQWHEIYNEGVVKKNKEDVLVYGHDDGGESVEIENLAIKAAVLKHLLRVYRGRFEAQNNPQT
jgi:hypothetical protein